MWRLLKRVRRGWSRVPIERVAANKSFKNPRDRHVEIAQTRPPWLVEGPH